MSHRTVGAIAHEIGHLPLNDVHHPDAGLMRAVWSVVELRRNRTTDWLFGRAEAETMRVAVTARSTAHPEQSVADRSVVTQNTLRSN